LLETGAPALWAGGVEHAGIASNKAISPSEAMIAKGELIIRFIDVLL
jgi:hypothetical protein